MLSRLSNDNNQRNRIRHRAALFGGAAALALMAVSPASAQDNAQSATFFQADGEIERLNVVGSRARAFRIPGSATYIGPEDIDQYEYNDIHRILREAPGVSFQEEDGFGLRPNIGIRGSGAERSSRITLMEDGVLIAPAPYAAPAAYYFPTAGRLHAVEVRKGSSAVKFGPRTIGGAINLISTPIPDGFGAELTGRFGEFGFKELHGIIGQGTENLGVMLETFQAEADGFKTLPSGDDTGFDIEDYLAKFRIATDQDAEFPQELTIKLGATDQLSNETYLGLTDEDFAEDPFQRYPASQLDEFNSEHYQVQATHHVDLRELGDLTTVAYYNEFERDWFKLDDLDFQDGRGRIRPNEIFENPDDPLNIAALAILRGEADSPDDALQLRHNAREYYSWGIQTIYGRNFDWAGTSHNMEIGLRYHEDQEDRQQNRENFRMENGVLVPTSVDPVASQANRVADARAFAAFVQDEITWGRLIAVPGVRIESIELTRRDFSTADPDRAQGPTGTRENDLTVVIPGIGFVYQFDGGFSGVLGVHKGFSPPGPSNQNASEEESINVEAGFRYEGEGLRAEAIAFYNDYSNILGTCTNAVGCVAGDIGDQFNGGAVDVIGLEASASYVADLGEIADGLRAPMQFVYTFTDAEFQTTFTDSFWGDVVEGDNLPYLSNHQLFASIGLEYRSLSGELSVHYADATRAEAGQGPIPQLEKIGARAVFDLVVNYQFNENVRLFGEVQNLFDEVYVAARRPYGARPGKPQSLIGGLQLTF